MPSLMMKQSALAEMKSLLIEVELCGAKLVHCPMDPRNSTVVLTEHFIVKSCSVEFVCMISKVVCSKLSWVHIVPCRPIWGEESHASTAFWLFRSGHNHVELSVAVWTGIRAMGFCLQDF